MTALVVIARHPYMTLKKAIFSSPEICGDILKIFGVGLNTPNLFIIYLVRPESTLSSFE